MKKFTIITGNKNKFIELSKILSPYGQTDCLSIDLTEIQGISEEIITKKIEQAISIVSSKRNVEKNEYVIVEDVSLCFDSLNGLPGPYIRSFYEKIGNVGLVKMLEGFENKNCIARCIIGVGYLSTDDSLQIMLFDGQVSGKIVEPRTQNQLIKSFGWDPIFEEKSTGQTFAEMSIDQKIQISHRTNALNQFCEWLHRTV